MPGNTVRVAVRTRPTAAFAQDQIFIDPANGSVDIYNKIAGPVADNRQDTWRFKFQHLLHNVSQDEVYDGVCHDIVASTCNGQSGCLMTYGQTGSGKTYTMLGDPKSFRNRGIVPRALAQVFQHVASKPETEYTVSVSFMEIYGPSEKIRDLLVISGLAAKHGVPAGQAAALGVAVGKDGKVMAGNSIAPPLGEFNIVEDPAHGTVVRGLTLVPVSSEDDALSLLYEAELWRTTAQHHLNTNSNRSHCIFTVHLTSRSRLGGGRDRISSTKLHLVDLAGSERLKKTMGTHALGSDTAESILQAESMAINKSLTLLEQCVVALTTPGRSFIPFRSSRLTNILKDALGGACNTCLIACVWGEARHLEETISTLRLAQRMTSVQLEEAGEAVTYDPEELLKKLQRQVAQLKMELQMHDALANRTDVQYGEYTPEQQAALASRIRDFLGAGSAEAEVAALPLESVAQFREILRQMKIMVKAAGVEAEERLRAKYAMMPRGEGAGEAGAARGGSAGPNGPGSASGAGAGTLDADVSGVGLGLAPAGARPAGDMLLPPSMSSRSLSASSRGMSATSVRGGGGGAGSAATGMGSPVNSPSRPTGRPGAGVPMEVNAAWRAYKNDPSLGGEQAAEVAKLRRLIGDKKTDMAGHVREVNACKGRIEELTQKLVDIRAQLAVRPASGRPPSAPVPSPAPAPAPVDPKAAKGGKDATPTAAAPAPVQPAPAPAVTQDDEFRTAHELAETKKMYKAHMEQYNSARGAVERLGADMNALLAALLSDFETWFAQSTGRLPPVALSPIRAMNSSMTSSSPMTRPGFGATAAYDWSNQSQYQDQGGANLGASITGGRGLSENVLDEAEAFEALELQRAADSNPGSETYFTATRKIREGARPHGRRNA